MHSTKSDCVFVFLCEHRKTFFLYVYTFQKSLKDQHKIFHKVKSTCGHFPSHDKNKVLTETFCVVRIVYNFFVTLET